MILNVNVSQYVIVVLLKGRSTILRYWVYERECLTVCYSSIFKGDVSHFEVLGLLKRISHGMLQ